MSKHPTKMIQEFSRLMIPVTPNEQANKTWRLHNTLRNTIPLEGGSAITGAFKVLALPKAQGGIWVISSMSTMSIESALQAHQLRLIFGVVTLMVHFVLKMMTTETMTMTTIQYTGLKHVSAESHYLISLPWGWGGGWEKAIKLDSDHFGKHQIQLIHVFLILILRKVGWSSKKICNSFQFQTL